MAEPDSVQSAVQAYYNTEAEHEWQRADRHRMEFAVTFRAMADHLPRPGTGESPVRVLDCGCGPGRYAITLAQQGYAVTLFDLSPAELTLAQERAQAAGVTFAGVEQGTATDMSRFPDESFDVVLLMGPLYHLLEEAGRRQALAEAYRVANPGGMVWAAFITRYAAHRDAAARDPLIPLAEPDVDRRLLETGQLPPRPGGGFIAYQAHPNEVAPLCRSVGLDVETLLGVEGLVSMLEGSINTLEGAAWDYWVNLNYTLASDPSIHGSAAHLLAICRKPRWRTVLRTIVQRLASSGIAYRVVGGTALALRGLPVPVHDLDLEMPVVEDVYRFGELFSQNATMPVAWREGPAVRSHFGRFQVEGVTVEAMGGLEWHRDGRWVPSLSATSDCVALDGLAVPVLELEEEALACLRRGRLERVALALPHCNPERLQTLLAEAARNGMF
ncbi:MAG: methyltransferase domain-containing protein [Anaerolineae bacterium]|nr:methyltransferase domain-containing protein [Anaerolineae bacterium]